MELTEEALPQIMKVAIEQIREGLETTRHIEAAEQDIRSDPRYLVLAEREAATSSTLPTTFSHTRDRPTGDLDQIRGRPNCEQK
jgi:hypothetical protein